MSERPFKTSRKKLPKQTDVIHREGCVIFDTEKRKYITPSQWHPKDGKAINIRYWDFLKREKDVRSRERITYEIRYDKNRKRAIDK